MVLSRSPPSDRSTPTHHQGTESKSLVMDAINVMQTQEMLQKMSSSTTRNQFHVTAHYHERAGLHALSVAFFFMHTTPMHGLMGQHVLVQEISRCGRFEKARIMPESVESLFVIFEEVAECVVTPVQVVLEAS